LRETAKPRPASAMRCTCSGKTWHIRKACVPGYRSIAVDPETQSGCQRRRGGLNSRHCQAGQSIWSLRLSSDHGPFEAERLEGQSQTGATHLAAGGAEGSPKTTQAGQAVAPRWILPKASAYAQKPRLVIRFPHGSHS
jgi:hypothetical protein